MVGKDDLHEDLDHAFFHIVRHFCINIHRSEDACQVLNSLAVLRMLCLLGETRLGLPER